MADTFTSRLRLQQPTVGADNNTWGGITNTDWQLVDDAVNGVATISLTGLSTYTLSANNGATDQARMSIYQFTGALTGDCTVTLPNSVKNGIAFNGTTGGHNVILAATGLANTLKLPSLSGSPVGRTFYCDGSTGVTDLLMGGSLLATNGFQYFPGGLIVQFGSSATTNTGGVAVTFPLPFTTSLLSFTTTINGWNGSSPVAITLACGQGTKSLIEVVATNSQTGAFVTTGVGFYWMAIGY